MSLPTDIVAFVELKKSVLALACGFGGGGVHDS
jgi:hypothetical protein